MKNIGNDYFKGQDFEAAILVYETILDVLIPDLSLDEDEYLPFHKLLVSSFLNQTACYLKLGNYNEVISLCNRIVLLDGSNAKVYYRRAQAYSHIGDLHAAIKDYEKAQELEPHDRKIKMELVLLLDQIHKPKPDSNDKGKQIVCEVSDGVGCSYNVQDTLPSKDEVMGSDDNDSLGNTEDRGPLDVVMDTDNNEFLGRKEDHGPLDGQDVVSTPCKLKEEFTKTTFNKLDDIVPDTSSIFEGSNMFVEQLGSAKPQESANDSISQFVNQRRPNSQLRISSTDVKKLVKGENLYFHHSKSGCVLRVRALSSKTPTMKETFHDNNSWEAEVSKDPVTPCVEADIQNFPLDTNMSEVSSSTFVFSNGASGTFPTSRSGSKVQKSKTSVHLRVTKGIGDKKKLRSCGATVGDKRKFTQTGDAHAICSRIKHSPLRPMFIFSFRNIRQCKLNNRRYSQERRTLKLSRQMKVSKTTHITRRILHYSRFCRLSIGTKRKAERSMITDVFRVRKKLCCSSIALLTSHSIITSSSDFGGLVSSSLG